MTDCEAESEKTTGLPDVDYSDIGGLAPEIKRIREAVEMPRLHPDHYAEYSLSGPSGIFLHGPSGCGKTMLGKAAARFLIQCEKDACGSFFHIRGPELLDKDPCRTGRNIQDIFASARDRAESCRPVVLFFDDMEVLFPAHALVEASVPAHRFIMEIENRKNVDPFFLIGASNRPESMDPAVLRPGRFDIHLRIPRPDRRRAMEILFRYLTPDLPMPGADTTEAREKRAGEMIEKLTAVLYDPDSHIAAVGPSGNRLIHSISEFVSGARLESVVVRAKTIAVKRRIFSPEEPAGIVFDDLLSGLKQEFAENSEFLARERICRDPKNRDGEVRMVEVHWNE